MRLSVTGDKVAGILPDGSPVTGDGLIDAKIWFSVHKKPADRWLRIVREAHVPFMVPSFPTHAPAYDFMAGLAATGEEVPFCSSTLDPEAAAVQGTAVVYRGDRYDVDTGEVITVTESDTWVNIACIGTATSKLHRMRYTTAGSDATHTSTQKERQAMLRMLRADYCGTGTPFTTDGHPLYWLERNGWFRNPAWTPSGPYTADVAIASIDAIWNSDGAACLSLPRLLRTATDPLDFFRVFGDIVVECNVPGHEHTLRGCSLADVDDWAVSAHAISLNPTNWP
jgi:hypothetical protein